MGRSPELEDAIRAASEAAAREDFYQASLHLALAFARASQLHAKAHDHEMPIHDLDDPSPQRRPIRFADPAREGDRRRDPRVS